MKRYRPDITTEEHLLDDLDSDISLMQAGQGLRFVNYLIDHLLLYLFWRFFGNHLISSFYTTFNIYLENRILAVLAGMAPGLFLSVFYYTGFEYFSHGKTPGKWITGTRAVKEDGHVPDFKTALIRSLSRLVPVDVFTALGKPCYPWHDQWSNSCVVEERYSLLPAPKEN